MFYTRQKGRKKTPTSGGSLFSCALKAPEDNSSSQDVNRNNNSRVFWLKPLNYRQRLDGLHASKVKRHSLTFSVSPVATRPTRNNNHRFLILTAERKHTLLSKYSFKKKKKWKGSTENVRPRAAKLFRLTLGHVPLLVVGKWVLSFSRFSRVCPCRCWMWTEVTWEVLVENLFSRPRAACPGRDVITFWEEARPASRSPGPFQFLSKPRRWTEKWFTQEFPCVTECCSYKARQRQE